MKQKLLTLFTLLLFVCSGAWGQTENVGDYSTQVIYADGRTSTWTFILPSSQVNAVDGKIDNDILYKPSASGKMKFTSSNQFSWQGESSGYIYVPAGASGTITMTVKGSSDTRYLQLYVDGEAASENYRLYSKLNAGGITADGKKGPQSFAFTASQLTTVGGKTYLHFKDNNTEMKIATFTVTLTSGSYSAPSIPTLTGAWKVGGKTVTEGAINIGGDVPELSLDVNATSGTPESSDYTITYSKTGDEVVEITGDGSGFTLKNNVTGSATLTATVTSNDESKFLDAAENYSYTYTVNRVDNSNLAVTPATGTYVGKTTVTMTYEEGYTVYYTTDGSDPEDAEGTRSTYSAPFDVTSTTTVKVIPYIAADGYGNVVERTYTINAPATPTFTPGAGAVLSGKEISISSTDDGATIYYTTDGTEPSNTYGTEYDADAKPTITGATTIKAISYVNGVASTIAEAEYTIKTLYSQTNVTGSTTWDWEGLTSASIELSGTTTPKNTDEFVLKNVEIYNDYTIAGFAGDAQQLKVIAQYPFRKDDKNGKMFQGDKIQFHTTVPGYVKVTYSNTGGKDNPTKDSEKRPYRYVKVNEMMSEEGSASTTHKTTEAFFVPAGDVAITGYISDANDPYSRSGDNVGAAMLRIYKVEFTEVVPVTISDAKYATLSSTEKLDFTDVEGMTAYKATATSENSVTLEDVTGIVPAETGLLLKGDAATYYIPVSTADATANVTGNKLQSTAKAAHNIAAGEVGRAFVFGKLGEEVGFFKAAEGKTIGVGKSYLLLDAAPAKDVEFLSFVFGDEESETTGIKAVVNEQARECIYDLQGRKVTNPTKGLYIVNGKKVIIK